jgi:hypothetical protein
MECYHAQGHATHITLPRRIGVLGVRLMSDQVVAAFRAALSTSPPVMGYAASWGTKPFTLSYIPLIITLQGLSSDSLCQTLALESHSFQH